MLISEWQMSFILVSTDLAVVVCSLMLKARRLPRGSEGERNGVPQARLDTRAGRAAHEPMVYWLIIV